MKKTVKIEGIVKKERISTQKLLQTIQAKIEEGYTNFEVNACGQHDIGGASKNKQGKTLTFRVTDPGQRVGAMGMSGTEIYVKGSTPADVGWLNSGAKIVVDGDCGDTAAHCAASGKIYVSGRVGTRSGALMKFDPKFSLPEFWVLKNAGSFGFEFMGGGIAVICGYDCDGVKSILGDRACVGMVGGTVYVRGNIKGVADCVQIKNLEKSDKDFLKNGMAKFLKEINRQKLSKELLNFKDWKKIVPKDAKDKKKLISVKEFHEKDWVSGGIFGDFIQDDNKVFPPAASGIGRLQIPKWDKKNCVNCKLCLNNCPQNAIVEENGIYSVKSNSCIGCSFCAAVCPNVCWIMLD